jgi:hypothetical protein
VVAVSLCDGLEEIAPVFRTGMGMDRWRRRLPRGGVDGNDKGDLVDCRDGEGAAIRRLKAKPEKLLLPFPRPSIQDRR